MELESVLEVDHSRRVDELSELLDDLDEGDETVLRLTSELVLSELVLQRISEDDCEVELRLERLLLLLFVEAVDLDVCARTVELVLSLLRLVGVMLDVLLIATVEELLDSELVLRPFFVELEEVESVDALLLLEFVTLERDVLVDELEDCDVSVLEVVSQLLRLLLLLELVEFMSLVEDDDCGDTELVVRSKKVELESVELVVLMWKVESVLEVDSELLDIEESVSRPIVELLQLVDDWLVADCSDGEISLGVELLFSTKVEVDDVLLELELLLLVDMVLDE